MEIGKQEASRCTRKKNYIKDERKENKEREKGSGGRRSEKRRGGKEKHIGE